jgi:hypothetical protein
VDQGHSPDGKAPDGQRTDRKRPDRNETKRYRNSGEVATRSGRKAANSDVFHRLGLICFDRTPRLNLMSSILDVLSQGERPPDEG